MDERTMIVTVVVAVLGSQGLWQLLGKLHEKKDAKTMVLRGLAHQEIIELGRAYLAAGSISEDDYENLHDYLFVPYEKMGGNGAAKRIMQAVEKLPVLPEPARDGRKK